MRTSLFSAAGYLGLFVLLEAAFPAPALAYLDPGTGNILVYVAISLVGTVLYFLKNLVYAVMGRARGEQAGRRELWIQFPDQKECIRRETELLALLADSDGQDRVVLYAAAEKSVKRLPAGQTVDAGKELIVKLEKSFGEGNVKVVEKRIENIRRMQ